jgi:octaprenyl-diphosphate synthase
LREGKATLAIVHALERGTTQEHEAIRRVLEDLSFERTSHQEVLQILDRHGSVQYALDSAFQYAEVARAALAGLPESDYKRALLWMPDFVVARDK